MDTYIGYRFHPSNKEIITRYLEGKMDYGTDFDLIKEVNICSYEPWELPDYSPLASDGEEWYFFHPITYKYANSSKIDRKTNGGFWKVTGYDTEIYNDETNEVIGTKKTLVYYNGCGSNATKTHWVIHEFHTEKESSYENPYVLCHLKKK